MKVYQKLVRDKIPKIIEKDGRKTLYYVLSEEQYLEELEKKLGEELQEYQADKNPEQLVDLLEILYSIGEAGGYSISDMNYKREEKARTRGRFTEKYFLETVDDGTDDPFLE